MPKVYIVNQAGHDFEKAKRFGDELVPVTQGNINVFRPDRTLYALKNALKHFGAEDFLLLSGNTLGNVLAALAVTQEIAVINILVYDAKNNDYLHHRLDTTTMMFLREKGLKPTD